MYVVVAVALLAAISLVISPPKTASTSDPQPGEETLRAAAAPPLTAPPTADSTADDTAPTTTTAPATLRPQDRTDLLTEADWATIERADEVGAKAVLADLAVTFDDDPRNSGRCHELVHELGRRAFTAYGSVLAAVDFDSSWCGAGYVHGVFEEWGRTTSLAVIEADAVDLCETFPPEMLIKCAHGVGHAIIQHAPNLPTAFDICELLGNASWDCILGVLMLYAQTNLTPEGGTTGAGFDVVGFCNLVPKRYLNGCHFESGTTWLNNGGTGPIEALRVCTTVEGSLTGPARCAEGLGGLLPDFVGVDVAGALELCEEGPASIQRDCAAGAIKQLRRLYAERGLGNVCDATPPRWEETCVNPAPTYAERSPAKVGHGH